jgi:hypothetical protein
MTAATELTNLQVEQLQHDEFAHKDILCLPIQTRIKHMVLHFSKYVGKLVEARQLQSHELLVSTIVDTWIIVLASANMLNLKLSERLNSEDRAYQNLNSLGQTFVHCIASSDPFDLALFELGKITGRMAKACESLDHMEGFSSRESLEEGVLEIARLSLAVSALLQINLLPFVSHRWKQVERKSIFYQDGKESSPVKDIFIASRTKLA